MLVNKKGLYKIKRKYDVVIILGILHLNKKWEKFLNLRDNYQKNIYYSI